MKMALKPSTLVPLILFLFIPFLLLGFFNFPSADDYSYANMAISKGFWGAQLEWYQVWSGRYIASALLSVSPVVYHWFAGYKLIGVLTYLGFMFCSFFFVKALVKDLFPAKSVFCVYLLFSLMYLCEMPSITEAFHWFPGVVNYTLALMIFILGAGYYIRSTGLSIVQGQPADFTRSRGKDALVLSMVSFLLPGINESLVVVWLYLICLVGLYIWTQRKRLQYSLLIPIFVGLASFYFVYRAPGNAIRAGRFEHKHDLLFTLFRPLGLEIEIFFRYLKPSVILFLLLLIPLFIQLKDRIRPEAYTRKARWWTVFIYVSVMFLFLAPAHWAMGGAPARRALNSYCYLHLLLVFLMFGQWVWAKTESFKNFHQKLLKYYPQKIQIVVLVVSLFAISNIGEAWGDLVFRARTYAHEQQIRLDQLKEAGSEQPVVLVPLTYKPETLFFSDVSEDPAHWINQSIGAYFGVHSVHLGK